MPAFSPRSPAYLAQEVDIVEGGQKCGRHVSGSCKGPSCRLGGPEEPSERRSRTGATTNNGRGAGEGPKVGRERERREREEEAWTGFEGAPGVRRGGKGEKQRALLRAPGCQAHPPPARSRRQLADCWNSGAGEPAPYIARRVPGEGTGSPRWGLQATGCPPASGRQMPSRPPIGRRQFFSSSGGAKPRGGAPGVAWELGLDGCCCWAVGRRGFPPLGLPC